MTKLQIKYDKIINKYVSKFCKKNDVCFDFWVGDEVGGIACIGDYTFNFSEIKYSVDNDIPFDVLADWYWFVVEYQNCYYNLDSYYRLRRDYVNEKGFAFNQLEFEKYLIYLRIKSKE